MSEGPSPEERNAQSPSEGPGSVSAARRTEDEPVSATPSDHRGCLLATTCPLLSDGLGSLQFTLQAPRQRGPPHPEVGRERPEWIPKGGWPIVLDEIVAHPRKCVTADKRGQQQAPAAGDDC